MSDAGLRLEDLPLATLLVEGEVIVDANALAEALVGAPRAALAGRAWLELVAPDERGRVAERSRRRLAGAPEPTVYETAFLDAAGERVPVEVRLRQAGARAIVHLVDLRQESRRRAHLAALAGLGAAVQRLLSTDEVHLAVRRGLFQLGLHSTFTRAVGEGMLRVDWTEDGTEVPLLEQALGIPIIGAVRPHSPAAARIWNEGGAFLDDWPDEAERFVGLPIAHLLRSLPPPGRFEQAIGIRVDVEVGVPSGILVVTGDWLRPDDVPAFRLFGSQFSAALAAARSIDALQARNADLAAMNRVADAAAFAPDFREFLARAEEVVCEVAGARGIAVLLVDGDRREASLAWRTGVGMEVGSQPRAIPLDHRWMASVVGEGRTVVLHPQDFPAPVGEAMRDAGIATSVALPLRFRSGVLGVLGVDFPGPPRDGAACRVPLLQAMAAHFAAAIESHQLLDDLRSRVGELTLLNDVAVATGALDPALLLDNALRRVAATLRADVGIAYLSQGPRLEPAALLGLSREEHDAAPPAEKGSLAQVVAATAAPVRYADEPTLDGRRAWFRARHGVEAAVGVPLLAKERVLGSLVLGRRGSEPFDDAQVRLLSAVGVQLGMAVENARLLADTQRRIRDLEAVNSLALRVFTTAPGDAQKLRVATCREIAEALDAEAAVILSLDEATGRLEGVAGWGTPIPAEQLALDLAANPVAAEALRSQEPAWAPEVVLSGTSGPAAPRRAPPLSLLFVPLTSRARTRGLVAVADAPARRYGEAEVALAYALASEAAMGLENADLYAGERARAEELARLAAENARLYEDLRRSYADLARAQEQLIRQERLAALGQLAAVVAHEVRNPLGVIFNSLGTLRRLVQPTGDAKMLLDIVGEESDRLNRIVGDLLDFARPSTPRLRPEPLERVLDEAAAAALAEASGRVRLQRDVPPDLPAVPMDARLMRQAVLNVLVNAVQAMPEGGTLTLRARPVQGAVRLEIADTGCGIPEEVRHRIFEPFFTTRPTGTGLGLAVVKRILDDHRATAEVETVEHGGTRFVFRLPLEAGGLENPPPPWSI